MSAAKAVEAAAAELKAQLDAVAEAEAAEAAAAALESVVAPTHRTLTLLQNVVADGENVDAGTTLEVGAVDAALLLDAGLAVELL